MADSSIKIAVRVRPFNAREKEANAQLVVKMAGATTTLLPPPLEGKTDRKYEERSFTFDYSYWTHDGFYSDDTGKSFPNPGSNYAGQDKLFSDVGGTIMSNAWSGFNTTLLAYGQTGSGKSYSMFGYGANKGLIPMFCEDLFVMLEKKKTENQGGPQIEYNVAFSMLEIYQDKVRDLLDENGGDNLKVRNHPKLGFYVENLKSIPVFKYEEIERLCDRGTKSRTVASTRMNATSSRSHTIIIISFAQINKADNTEKRSLVNLVDLAGSERQGDTQSEGKTLKEGANINSSLTTLGQVISCLVQKQNDPIKNKSMVIPYRNSTLTKLLANSLGGNSKTIMIGAISPAHDAYEDTLSTLRFLDRAKGIKNVATINENPVDKLIRELREENEALKKRLLEGGGGVSSDGGQGMDPAEVEEIKRQIAEQEIAMKELNKSWAQKLEEAMLQKSIMQSETDSDKLTKEKKMTHPYLSNVNEDPLLSGMILHFIEPGEHAIGRLADTSNAEIQLSGLNILPIHGFITRNVTTKEVIIRPAYNGVIRVNGRIIYENPNAANDPKEVNGVILCHNDRIMFGLSHLYVVKFPGVEDAPNAAKLTSFSHAQREIAAAEGYGVGDSGLSNALIDAITEVLAGVQEANAIAEELMIPKRYVLIINKQEDIDSDIRGLVSVKVKDFEAHKKWLMSKSQFLEAQSQMKDMYVAYIDGGGSRAIANWPSEKNPFLQSIQDWLIATGRATFKNLMSVMRVKESILLQNLKGANEGILKVLVDVTMAGVTDLLASSIGGNLESVADIEKKLKITITTDSVQGLRWSKGPVYCRYRIEGLDDCGFHDEELIHTTQAILSLNPKYNNVYVLEPKGSTPAQGKNLLHSLGKLALNYEVYGKYDDKAINKMYGNNKTGAHSGDELKEKGKIHSPPSLERIEVHRQETNEEVEALLSILDSEDTIDTKKTHVTELVSKFKHNLQLIPLIAKSDALSETAKEALSESKNIAGGSTAPFLSKIEEMIQTAKTEADLKAIADFCIAELDKYDNEERDPEIEKRVQTRRILESFICNLRDMKDDEDHFKSFALEILDKCCDEDDLAAFKKELVKTNAVPIANIDLKMPAQDTARLILQTIESRHLTGRETISKFKQWTDDPKLRERYVPFPKLSSEIQKIKKETALIILGKYQSIQESLRKTEGILMGEISKNVERGAHHYDEDDKQLLKNREQLALLAQNKQAIGTTVDAIAMAESRMTEQSKRMEALKTIVNQQASRGAYLEKLSLDQTKDLQVLKAELDRLQTVLKTREEEHRNENKALGDQLIEKSNQLGIELLNSARLRSEIAKLKGEIERLKVMLDSSEKTLKMFTDKEGNEKIKALVEEQKQRAAEIAALKEKISNMDSTADEAKQMQAIQALSEHLSRMDPNYKPQVAKLEEKQASDGKVSPEYVAVKQKKGCVIL